MKFPRIPKRVIATVALAFLAALAIAPGSIAAVLAADVPTPGAPSPINVLPSTIRGSLPLTGVPGQQQYLATMLYSYARKPEFWRAVNAAQAGTATAQQITLVQSANGTFTMPASRAAGLVKVLGPVGTVITGWTAGVAVGAGTLDGLRSVGLLSFDPYGAVCANVGSFVGGLIGADCTGWGEIPPDFVVNQDAVGVGWGPLCNAAGTWCLQYLSSVSQVAQGSALWSTYRSLCFDRTVGSGDIPAGASIVGDYTPSAIGGNYNGNQSTPSNIHTGGVRAYALESGSDPGSTMFGTKVPASAPCPAGTDFYVKTRIAGQDYTYVTPATPPLPTGLGYKATSSSTPIYADPLSGDPLRTLRCVIVTSGGTYTLDSPTFKESDGVIPSPVCPDIPAGQTLTSTEIREVNLEDGTWLTLWSESTTPEYQGAQELAPECSDGTCMLDLLKNGLSCFQQPAACLDWFSDPNKGSTYSCKYGTHAVDLAECNVYAPAFTPEATTTGNTYGDPTSGAAVQNPNPVAGTDPDGSGQACYPSGWAVFNPIEWVYRPIVCAAEWAFVPRTEVVEQIGTRVTTAWADTLPAQAPTIVEGWTQSLPVLDEDESCLGPAINFDGVMGPFGLDGGETMYPLSVCEEPWATIALIANIVSTLSVTVAGGFASVRYISATFGFPGIGRSSGGSA